MQMDAAGDDVRSVKRPRIDSTQEERSFTVPGTLSPGTRVEVFHRREAVPMGWYAAEVRSVDINARLLEVRYASCSPGHSSEWLSYSNNHDLAFLPSKEAAVAPVAAAASPAGAVGAAASLAVSASSAESATAATAAAVDASGTAASAPTSASICVEEISLLDSDEEDGVITTRTIEAPAGTTAVTLIASASDESDDDAQGGDADDVVVKGASASDYPHARCNCTLRRFFADLSRTPATDKQNGTTCKNCYCLVCDVLATECSRWRDPVDRRAPQVSTDNEALSIAHTSHCLASDKAEAWVKIRQAAKHHWVKDSRMYDHLGPQCYGASADYIDAAIGAFEAFANPLSVPGHRSAQYSSIKKVDSTLSRGLAHCAALSVQSRKSLRKVCDEGAGVHASSQEEELTAESHYELGGYRFKVLPKEQSAGIAIAIADAFTSVAVRQTWRPPIRNSSSVHEEANREAFRRMIGKIDSAWARALLAQGVSDATRAVARQRLAELTEKAAERHAWKLQAANQAAENGWTRSPSMSAATHLGRMQEHRRLVAVKLEHLAARLRWEDALDYAAKADPNQLPALLVKSGQLLKGVKSVLSKVPARPIHGWPDQDGRLETAAEVAARDQNNDPGAAPTPGHYEQAKRLRAAPGSDMTAVAALIDLKESPRCVLLLALSTISATPLLPHWSTAEVTRSFQKMARLAIVSVLKGTNSSRNDGKHMLHPAELTRRQRKGKDAAETVRYEKLATEVVSDGGSLPPIGLGSGCSNRLRELIETLNREIALDWHNLRWNDSDGEQASAGDYLQWCGEMAIELVIAACLRALWQPMVCADRGDVEHWPKHLRERGFTGTGGENNELNRQLGYRGDGVIPSGDQMEQLSTANAARAASVCNCDTKQQAQTDEDMFWSTLMDLHDGRLDPAASGTAQRHEHSEPTIPRTSAWGSHPWHTGMIPGQQNTYPRGRYPLLMAAPLAALRSLAETSLECGDPRGAVHLLKPLMWSCVDLGATATEACCQRAAMYGSSLEETRNELKRCIHFVFCDLLPQIGSAAFSREVMLPPYHTSWSCRDSATNIWPPAPKPQRGKDKDNVRVDMPWYVFAKHGWRSFVTMQALGMLSVQLLTDAASESQSDILVAANVPAHNGGPWPDGQTAKAACKAANMSMYVAARRNAEESGAFFGERELKSSVSASASACAPGTKPGKRFAPGLAVLRKIVPKSESIPSSFPAADAKAFGGSSLTPAHQQLVVYLANACVAVLLGMCKLDSKYNGGVRAGTEERVPLELDLARRLALSYFFTKPCAQAVQILRTVWMAGKSITEQQRAASTWTTMQQHFAQLLGSYALPNVHVRVLRESAPSVLKDNIYCDRLAALACLSAWSTLRDIAMRWWMQGTTVSDHCLGEKLLKPIDCGSATLRILIGQVSEGGSGEDANGKFEGAQSSAVGAFFNSCKPEPTARRTATVPCAATHACAQKTKPVVALSDAALVDLCVYTVVPFCVAVLESVELNDVMPITTGCGIFNELLRWVLTLKPAPVETDRMSCQLNLARSQSQPHSQPLPTAAASASASSTETAVQQQQQALRQQQQQLLKAVDNAMDRVAASAVRGKVSPTRKETIIKWLQMVDGWAATAAESRGVAAADAQKVWRNSKLAAFLCSVKRKAALAKGIKAAFSDM